METKKQYIAPELTVVTFKVERGYATSGGSDPLQALRIFADALTPGLNSSQEVWSSEENLFGGNDNTWTY